MSKAIEIALEKATEVRLKAHAPYSNFLVGACLKIKGSDDYISGNNVENASYGGTLCAERNALTSMIAHAGKQQIEFMVLITDTDPVATPCGMCRQVMSEFMDADTPIHMANLNGIQKSVTLSQLLPYAFDKSSL